MIHNLYELIGEIIELTVENELGYGTRRAIVTSVGPGKHGCDTAMGFRFTQEPIEWHDYPQDVERVP